MTFVGAMLGMLIVTQAKTITGFRTYDLVFTLASMAAAIAIDVGLIRWLWF